MLAFYPALKVRLLACLISVNNTLELHFKPFQAPLSVGLFYEYKLSFFDLCQEITRHKTRILHTVYVSLITITDLQVTTQQQKQNQEVAING